MTTKRERFENLLLELLGQSDFSKYVESFNKAKLEKIRNFIEQEIKLAVEKEREDIVGILEKMVVPYDEYGMPMGDPSANQAIDYIIDLIKNRV